MDVTLLSVILILSALFSAVIYFLIAYFSKKQRLLRYHASKLEGPPALPLIGSAFYLIGSHTTIIKNVVYLIRKYKSPWKIWLGRRLYIVVTEPDDVEIVLNKALEKAENYKFLLPILKEGLFTGPVEKWKRHRKVILSTFSMPILKSFVEVFSEHSERILPKLDKYVGKGIFDVFPILTETALEITCETAMGTKISEQTQDYDYARNLSKALALVFMRLFQYWLHLDLFWQFSSYSKQLKQLSIQLEAFVQKIVTEKKLEYQQHHNDFCPGSKKRKCFLDHLVEISSEDQWADQEVLEEAQTMVAAGSESLGSTGSYTLIMIGMHPFVQDRIYEEIYNIFGNSNRTATSEDLTKMVYLEMVIKETLRLFPVAAALGRSVTKDIVTDKYTLPEGCECIVGVLYIHRNPKIWPQPLKFDPQRFLPEEVAKRHPYSYLPFSGGPRNCIGFKYALMTTKTVISTIIRRYKILTDFKSVSEIDFVPGVVLKSTRGYRISLESRVKN